MMVVPMSVAMRRHRTHTGFGCTLDALKFSRRPAEPVIDAL
jgi:hypothetical protein